jgi:hypothetical protein
MSPLLWMETGASLGSIMLRKSRGTHKVLYPINRITIILSLPLIRAFNTMLKPFLTVLCSHVMDVNGFFLFPFKICENLIRIFYVSHLVRLLIVMYVVVCISKFGILTYSYYFIVKKYKLGLHNRIQMETKRSHCIYNFLKFLHFLS